jgi:hypothetical protein
MKASLSFILLLIWTQVSSQTWIGNFAFRCGHSQATQSPDLLRIDQVDAWKNNIHAVYYGTDYYLKLNNKLGVTFGVQISQKGYQMGYNFYDNTISSETRYMFTLSYIDVPINFLIRKKKFGFTAGLAASYLLHADWRFRQNQFFYGNQYVVTYIYSNPTTFLYNRYDVEINLGVSRILNNYFEIEFNFLRGLTLPDKLPTGEIRYQESFLFGLRYYFLRPIRYPAGRQRG